MMTIGEFSTASCLTVKTLRLYEEKGILLPDRVDSMTGYRLYGDRAWARAAVVIALRETGMSHAEMKAAIADCSDDEDIADFLERRFREVDAELARLRASRDRINLYLRAIARKGTGDMKQGTGIIEMHTEPLAYCGIRFRGAYGDIGPRFAELFRKAGRNAAGAPMGLYHDGEYRESDADIEAALPVKRAVEIEGLACGTLPATRVLRAVHFGPYESIGDTYKLLFEAAESRSLVPLTPFREIYLKGPGMIFPRKPERFVTEIHIPVGERP